MGMVGEVLISMVGAAGVEPATPTSSSSDCVTARPASEAFQPL